MRNSPALSFKLFRVAFVVGALAGCAASSQPEAGMTEGKPMCSMCAEKMSKGSMSCCSCCEGMMKDKSSGQMKNCMDPKKKMSGQKTETSPAAPHSGHAGHDPAEAD